MPGNEKIHGRLLRGGGGCIHLRFGPALCGGHFSHRKGGDALIKSIYLIGSLRNPAITPFTCELEKRGYTVFSDWAAVGPDADDFLRDYYKARGRSYKETLKSEAAMHAFTFDKKFLDSCDAGVLLMPAGKSAHTELGYLAGKGKPVYILFDQEPERVEIMQNFATDVFFNREELFAALSSQSEEGDRYRDYVKFPPKKRWPDYCPFCYGPCKEL